MSINRWSKSRSASVRLGGHGGQGNINGEFGNQPRWLKLWRKIRRNKKKNGCNSSTTPYDPETYMQNFDEGSGMMEPDNLLRSFSARYADPSRLLRLKELLD